MVCLRALSIVFTPAFEDTERDPVDLSGYTLRFGCLVADEVAVLRSLWSRALPLLQSCGIARTRDALRELIHHWAYPGSGRGQPALRSRRRCVTSRDSYRRTFLPWRGSIRESGSGSQASPRGWAGRSM